MKSKWIQFQSFILAMLMFVSILATYMPSIPVYSLEIHKETQPEKQVYEDTVGNYKRLEATMERGAVSSVYNLHHSSNYYKKFVRSAFDIQTGGAKRLTIEPFNVSHGTMYVQFFASDYIKISSVAYTDGAIVNIPDGCAFIRIEINTTQKLEKLAIRFYDCVDDPREAKRSGINKVSEKLTYQVSGDVHTTSRLMLPPNYSIDGEKVPVILWLEGSGSGLSTWDGDFNSNKLPYLQYLRDEGFAVFSVYAWGNEYAEKYPQCGKSFPYPVPINLACIKAGIEYICSRYNLDADNIHIMSKSQGGQCALYYASCNELNVKSIGMFAPVLDYLSMPGEAMYKDTRAAIAEELGFTGDVEYFASNRFLSYSEEGRAFLRENLDKLKILNEAWTNLSGAELEELFESSMDDCETFWTEQIWKTDRTDIYTHTEYVKTASVPVKIWGARDDAATPYLKMVEVVAQLKNGGSVAELVTLPNGTCGHSCADGGSTRIDVTTALGIEHKNVPIGWVENIEWIRKYSVHTHFYTATITPPTYNEQGYTTHTCACGDSYVDEYVASIEQTEATELGRKNTLLNLKQIMDLQYTLQNDLPKIGSDTPWQEGTKLTGLPYSDVFMTDKYICYDVSFDTFMSAINNPRSDLYLKTTDTKWTKPIYGIACSGFVSYCFGFEAPYSTAEYAKNPDFVAVRPDQIQSCDVMLMNNSGGFGHIRIVEEVKYDESGFPTEIVVCEAVTPQTRRVTYSYEALMRQIDNGYRILRYTKLSEVQHQPLEYNSQTNNGLISDICASTGDKATIKAGEEVTLSILNAEGYQRVVVTKDGELFGEYGVSEDIVLTNLAGGVYEAKMYPENDHSTTRFIVCDVSATIDGNKVSFTFTNCTPLSICGTSANGGVFERFNVSEAEAAQGYKEVVFTDNRVKQIEVVFTNEYGNVAVYAVQIHRHEYTPNVVSPTCTKQGYTTYTCACGDSYVDHYTEITEHQYQNGVCTGCEKSIFPDIVDGHLQYLLENVYAHTNLWPLLEPEDVYFYAGNRWGKLNDVVSVTIPITSGDQIYASSFSDGIRVAFFDTNGLLVSLTDAEVKKEFAEKGYITAPKGAVAVNIPMWDNSADNVLKILTLERIDCQEHVFGATETVTEPGLVSEGVAHRHCEICGYTETIKIPALMQEGDYSYQEDGQTINLPYRIYYPASYTADSQKQWPVVLFYHGAGSRGTDNQAQGLGKAIISKLVELDNCIILAPQCPTDYQWVNTPWGNGSYDSHSAGGSIYLNASVALLNETILAQKVDEDRVYVIGQSMGGYATWNVIMEHPELFAAAIPVCGAADPDRASEILGVAVWAFHGDADDTVPVSGSREMIEAMRALGGIDVKYTEYAGVGHASWVNAFEEPGLLEWLFSHTKHKHSYGTAITDPTCTEQGYTTYTCACGDGYVDEIVAPLGHNYVDGLCDRCGEMVIVTQIGDLDFDGDVDGDDLAILIAGLLPEDYAGYCELRDEQAQKADLNGDGEINSADRVLLARSLLAKDHPLYRPL